MISLFLILCYFILIFNIIIPTISEKLKREYDAYTKYKNIKKDFICVDNNLFYYDFNISGLSAKMLLDNNKQKPLRCSEIKKANKNNYLSCENNDNDIVNFSRSCSNAYLNLFFTT
ncbi:hypothetical protein LW113 [Lumpy skin disease virus]|uniref:Entry-fusion complex component n=1 Tax=Lumpy skin disease virus TaxID=59509 RepID=A0A3G4YJ77_LSDV|nr:hypothetical protein LW113 [Lumpy skin disease virus]